MKKPIAAVAAVLAAAVLCAQSASGTGGLPPGPATAAPYLSGRTLHIGSTDIAVPPSVGSPSSGLQLVGHSARGWVVAAVETVAVEPTTVLAELYIVGPSGATRFFRRTYGHDVGSVQFRLSDGRRRILAWASTNSEASFDGAHAAVLDLDGTTVRHRTITHRATPLDFSGKRVVYSGVVGPTRLWRLGHEPRVVVDRPARFASFEENRLTVKSTRKRWRFVPLSRPHHQIWRARFDAVSISPNGHRVVGFSTSRPGRPIEVRRTRDGRLVDSWAVPPLNFLRTQLMWESDAAVLGDAVLDLNGIWTVMRCRVGGACERASGDLAAPVQFLPQ